MNFTYSAYERLINNIKENNYTITNYHDYQTREKVCILRHDIDYSMERAMKLAELEMTLNVRSTYFVLVSGSFYNVFSEECKEQVIKLAKMGHEIGLHFDETVYENNNVSYKNRMIDKILFEKELLESATGVNISVVSMHRPSKKTLNENLKIPGMINSYSEEFFDKFKYVSDSRRRWRENIEEIIKSKEYGQLHVLTHAFWYNDTELSLRETISQYLYDSKYRTWDLLNNNFTELDTVVKKEDI